MRSLCFCSHWSSERETDSVCEQRDASGEDAFTSYIFSSSLEVHEIIRRDFSYDICKLSWSFLCCSLSLKAQFTQTFQFCHRLLTLMLFQTCMNVFLLLNTKEDILKNVGDLMSSMSPQSMGNMLWKSNGNQKLFGYNHIFCGELSH